MLTQRRWRTVNLCCRLSKAPHRTNRIEGASRGVLNLLHNVESFNLGVSKQGRIVHEWHRVSIELVNEANDLIVRHLFETLLPNRFNLGVITANAGRVAPPPREARIVDVLDHAKGDQ